MTKIPDIEEDLLACIQCGYCNAVCPTYEEFKWESASPRGKIYFLKRFYFLNIIEKFIKNHEYKQGFVKSLYICAGCGACNKICPVRIELSHRWEELKEWLFFEGYAPMENHKPLLERVRGVKNPYNEPIPNRTNWVPEDVKLSTNPEILYFVGCTESYRRQEIASATARILQKADVEFTILGTFEQCCGSPLLRTGQTDIVKEVLMPQNIENMKKVGIETVVTACSGCFQTLTNDYPRVLGPLPFEVLHISQYIKRLLDEEKIQFEKEFEKKVTYHDPCHLGRHVGVFEEPRRLLTAVPGVEFVEMPRNRMGSRCCGAGGGFKIAFNDKATVIASKRVKEAVDTEAECIITTCPFCKTNLTHGAEIMENGIPTYDLMELVLKVL
ncbi:MAG: (Fe-S)-binding protein [Methanomassiliicoccales archaeon]|nr:MAG: (Fe-S)-binding protein [Methanomassiliicoccales archaeon]